MILGYIYRETIFIFLIDVAENGKR